MKRMSFPLLALAFAACATLRGGDDPDTLYRQGLDALARGDYAAAQSPLEYASRSGSAEAARRATVLLAVMQLDPANPARRVESVAGVVDHVDADTEQHAMFETVVASAIERVSRESLDLRAGLSSAQTQRDAAYATIDQLRARTDSLTADRDAARRKTSQLEQTAAECAKELEKKTQEIERIRRAIRR
jgi:dsDNA-specific endonuclease/ATPase MutS2